VQLQQGTNEEEEQHLESLMFVVATFVLAQYTKIKNRLVLLILIIFMPFLERKLHRVLRIAFVAIKGVAFNGIPIKVARGVLICKISGNENT